MNRKPDVRYIYYYADGNAARVPEPTPKKKISLPKAPKLKVQVISVDLMAVGGIVMSVMLLVTLLFGLVQLRSVQVQTAQMESYVYSLQNQNAELRYEYNNSYDLDNVRIMAESMGYIPVEEAKTENLILPEASEVREATVWERIVVFFTNLFA